MIPFALRLRWNYISCCRKLFSTETKSSLARHIYQKIKISGPITIADYMRDVLTNPLGGYYMNKDMFGETGDFVTSPEISQMFGEIVGVWLINEWQKMGSPKPLQIVELGPGRGTLASDIIRIFNHFGLLNQTTLQLVEVSPFLSELQSRKLCLQSSLNKENSAIYRQGIGHHNNKVEWYKQLNDVPKGFSLFVAHEFFDALPIHKFQKTENGYREVLIDIVPDIENEYKFRYVLARNPTPIQHSILHPQETRKHIEISPHSHLIYKDICERICEYGGLALICDYGHDGKESDTFRAYKEHKQVDPLVMPGFSDLTADVDFNTFRQVAKDVGGILTFGPVTQRYFLLKSGLSLRMENLKETLKDEKDLENLLKCYKMLTDDDKMGERFKFMSTIPQTMKKILDIYPMVGFLEK